MARLCKIVREKKLAIKIKANLTKRKKLQVQNKDMNLSVEERMQAQFALQKLRSSSPTRARSRCHLTGRSHGVYSSFGLGRNMLRIMAMDGVIPGLRKSSW